MPCLQSRDILNVMMGWSNQFFRYYVFFKVSAIAGSTFPVTFTVGVAQDEWLIPPVATRLPRVRPGIDQFAVNVYPFIGGVGTRNYNGVHP